MHNTTIKKIYNAIKKTIGKGPHKLHEPLFSGNEIKYVNDTIKKNFVSSSGEYTDKFEKKIEQFTGAKYAVAVINCTQALFISLKVLGISKNHEVLVPALTFIGTVNAISYTGAEPHFVDSCIDDLGIDCDKLEKYLKKKTKIINNKCLNKKTGKIISAIIPVHLFGHACDIEKLLKLSRKFKLKVIEDAAECLGSFFKGYHLGLFGDLGCLSFNGNKIITTGGGGVIITNKKNLAKKIKHLITTAKVKHKWEYIHNEIGYNFRMPSLNAALGLAQLEKIKIFLKLKRKLYKKYFLYFQDIPGVKVLKERKNNVSNYWLQTIILDKKLKYLKNDILAYCYKKNFLLRPIWKLISDLRPYKKKQKMNLSGSKFMEDHLINLPSSQSLLIKK